MGNGHGTAAISLAPGLIGGPLGVYVHVPFCVRKCTYCDFVSYPLPAAGDDAVRCYLSSLAAEVEWYRETVQRRGVASLYVGGGTPTALSMPELRELTGLLESLVRLSREGFEYTFEANPGTVDEHKLEALRGAGVNRLSLGVQSFDDQALVRIGRVHTAQQARDAIRQVRDSGIAALSVDLMFALPGQTVDDFARTLAEALAARPEHLSVYGLTLEDGTPLASAVSRGETSLPPEDDELRMYEMARRTLGAAGYAHYEISNFARPGHEAQHNVLYWQNREYLGLGPAAHGYLDGVRYANVNGVREYHAAFCRTGEATGCALEGPAGPGAAASLSGAVGFAEAISERTARAESMFLGLRLASGVSRRRFLARHGVAVEEVFGSALETLARRGLIELEGDAIRLSGTGLPVANRVFAAFV